jgi:peptide/nickel transport system permease protein
MLTYVARRIALGLFTVWVISILSFLIVQMPSGDFATTYVARRADAGSASVEAEAERSRDAYGLDEPIVVQYFTWIGRVVRGDFGMSFDWNRPVADVLGDRLVLSVIVSLAAIVFTWVVALPIGVYSAVRKYSIGDFILTSIGFLGLAVPSFLLALVLMYVGFRFFGVSVGGLFSPRYETAPWSVAKVWDLGKHLLIPAVVVGAAGTAQLIRIMRANLLDELRKPYVDAGRAKGLPEWRLVSRYPVRVAMNPFASAIGFLFPQVISGTVVVSVVLSLPTVGPLLLTALQAQDMYLAGAIVLLLGVLTVIGTLVSDLVLMWLDPRIRHVG